MSRALYSAKGDAYGPWAEDVPFGVVVVVAEEEQRRLDGRS